MFVCKLVHVVLALADHPACETLVTRDVTIIMPTNIVIIKLMRTPTTPPDIPFAMFVQPYMSTFRHVQKPTYKYDGHTYTFEQGPMMGEKTFLLTFSKFHSLRTKFGNLTCFRCGKDIRLGEEVTSKPRSGTHSTPKYYHPKCWESMFY